MTAKTAKAPAKPRKTQDKAGRASPPDRDGDGKSGGSLPGNKTVETAKGTADHVEALEQIAEDGLATIIIPAHAEGHRGPQAVGVNGRIRQLKVGVQVQVNAEELAALEASHVDYETVVPLGESPVDEPAVEGSSAGSPDEPEPAPAADEQPPAGEGDEQPKPEGEGEATQPEGTGGEGGEPKPEEAAE